MEREIDKLILQHHGPNGVSPSTADQVDQVAGRKEKRQVVTEKQRKIAEFNIELHWCLFRLYSVDWAHVHLTWHSIHSIFWYLATHFAGARRTNRLVPNVLGASLVETTFYPRTERALAFSWPPLHIFDNAEFIAPSSSWWGEFGEEISVGDGGVRFEGAISGVRPGVSLPMLDEK